MALGFISCLECSPTKSESCKEKLLPWARKKFLLLYLRGQNALHASFLEDGLSLPHGQPTRGQNPCCCCATSLWDPPREQLLQKFG